MENIADFVSQGDEIARLNKQLSMTAEFYDNFYKNKIKKLTKERNDIQRKYNRLKRDHKDKVIPARLVKAKAILWARAYGESILTNAEIAAKCFLCLRKVEMINAEVKNERPINNIN